MTPFFIELAPQPKVQTALEAYFTKLIEPTPDLYKIFEVPNPTVPPIVRDWFTRAGMQLDNSKFFRSRPFFRSMAHKDADGRVAAVNVPLFSIGGLMKWYGRSDWLSVKRMHEGKVVVRMASPVESEVDNDKDHRTAELASKVFTHSQTDLRADAALQLTRPTAVSVSTWHEIDSSINAHDRIVWTVRFRSNPTVEELAVAFAAVPTL